MIRPQRPAPERLERLCVVLGLALSLLWSVTSLPTTAPTFDEVAHLPAGYAQLQTGTPVFNLEHPPLSKLVAAVGLLPLLPEIEVAVPDWQQLDEWQFGRAVLFRQESPPDLLMLAGRLPMLAGTLALSLVVWAWSRRLWGPEGGFLSFALCTTCPILLAHGRLVTTDVPLALGGTLSAMLAWRLLERPSRLGTVLLGLTWGGALATKFSGIVLVLATTSALLSALWRSMPSRGEARTQQLAGHLAQALLLAWGVVVASYGWPIQPLGWIEGLAHIGFNHTPGHAFYLMGEFRPEGFLHYFLMAWLLKASPASLACAGLLMAKIGHAIFSRHTPAAHVAEPGSRPPRSDAPVPPPNPSPLPFLWWPAAAYVLFVQTQAPQIGVRYLIPVLPLLYIGCGALLARNKGASSPVPGSEEGSHELERRGKIRHGALNARRLRFVFWAGVCASSAWTLWQAWPDPISFFNGLGGCRGVEAYRCLDDSNLDWGQDLERASVVVGSLRHPGEEVRLLYFGTAHPSAWLSGWRRMQDEELILPEPRLYMVSAPALERLAHVRWKNPSASWIGFKRPAALVGNTIRIYDFRVQQVRREQDPRDIGVSSRLR